MQNIMGLWWRARRLEATVRMAHLRRHPTCTASVSPCDGVSCPGSSSDTSTTPALQRQIDRLSSVGAADHRFGPLHVMHARFEGNHGDLLRAANRIGELFFHTVEGPPFRGIGDLSELFVAAASGEDLLLLVNLDGALGAVKPDLIARGQSGGGAHAHVDLGAVG